MTTTLEPEVTFDDKLDLRQIADIYEQILKIRNGAGNRLGALEREADDTIPDVNVASSPLLAKLDVAIEETRSLMEAQLPGHPVYEWLMGIPGINRTIACRVVGLIPMTTEPPMYVTSSWDSDVEVYCLKVGDKTWVSDDGYRWYVGTKVDHEDGKRARGEPLDSGIITLSGGPMDGQKIDLNFSSFGKLRVFAGLCPGKNRLVKGEKACFNRRLKTALYIAFTSMLKANGARERIKDGPKCWYTDIYYKWREFYEEREGTNKKPKRGEESWSELHQHYAAKNKMLDVFMVHLWRTWRENTGWSVLSLYVHVKLGHHMDYDAADFSSEAFGARKIKQHAANVRREAT